MADEDRNAAQSSEARQFTPLPQGPQGRPQPVRPFARHRIISNDQFGQVTIPDPVRRSTPEMGEVWQGQQ